MTCITIASWMLAVVGAAVFTLSFYIAYAIPDTRTVFNVSAFAISIVCAMFGLLACICGIYPYIPEITLSCITLVP
jgi:hypothetical protein